MSNVIVAYLLVVLVCARVYFVLGIYYEIHLPFLDTVLTSNYSFPQEGLL